jgi:hypothetical protein
LSSYLLSRKAVDLAVIEWEKLYDKGKQTMSLPMFIRNKQAIHMAEYLYKGNIISEKFLNEIKTKIGDK